jgi:hypothetical protein
MHAVALVATGRQKLPGFVLWVRKNRNAPWQVRRIRPDGALLQAESIAPHAVNDQQVVVGAYLLRANSPVLRPFRYRLSDGFLDLGILDGDTHGVAHDVNNQGTILLSSDLYGAPNKGPRTYLWTDGTARQLGFRDPSVRFHVGVSLDDQDRVGGHLARFDEDISIAFVWQRTAT